jgi:uncharacterized heparinase superfamily protein
MSRSGFPYCMENKIQRGLAFLDKGPRYARTFFAWYASQQVRRLGLGRTWLANGSTFWSKLNLNQPPLAQVAAAVQAGNEQAAPQALLDYFRHRKEPAFFFGWEERTQLLDLIAPQAQAATVDVADQVAQRTFCLRGQPPITFDERVDWTYCPAGNIDWMWDLNRHFYFVTLGQAFWYTSDTRYAGTWAELLADWIAHNPADERQPNWRSPLEVAYRLNAWLWAYHLFVRADALDASTHLLVLRGLWTHGAYLNACLEYHVPNNHLLLESKALAMCGLLFPEFRNARAWVERGLSTLWRQVRQQVWPDGVHAEQASMYHQIIASELLELLILLENNGMAAPVDIVKTFARMLDFERAMTKPDGQIPLIGDSAQGDSYLRFSAPNGGAALLNCAERAAVPLDEATTWLLGPERVRRQSALPCDSGTVTSQAFPAGGYFIMRHGSDREAAYLIFDCGPFGHPPAPGHGHADALSFELYAGGRTLIVDPGVYSYHLGADWRNYFRSTAAHNTLTVDGFDQSVLLGAWQVSQTARTTLHEWVSNTAFDFVDGAHDGYARLPEPIMHRRQIFFVRPDYWILMDQLDGRGQHRFDLYFHLLPETQVVLDSASGIAQIAHDGKADLIIYPLKDADSRVEIITGSPQPIQGWVSRYSGEKLPAPVLRYTRITTAPAQFNTVLCPGSQASATPITAMQLAVFDEGGRALPKHTATGLVIEGAGWVDYFVADRRAPTSPKIFGHYTTDAELTYLRCRSADRVPLKAILHRGSDLKCAGVPLVLKLESPGSETRTLNRVGRK